MLFWILFPGFANIIWAIWITAQLLEVEQKYHFWSLQVMFYTSNKRLTVMLTNFELQKKFQRCPKIYMFVKFLIFFD